MPTGDSYGYFINLETISDNSNKFAPYIPHKITVPLRCV